MDANITSLRSDYKENYPYELHEESINKYIHWKDLTNIQQKSF